MNLTYFIILVICMPFVKMETTLKEFLTQRMDPNVSSSDLIQTMIQRNSDVLSDPNHCWQLLCTDKSSMIMNKLTILNDYLSPLKKTDQWYLTLAQTHREGNDDLCSYHAESGLCSGKPCLRIKYLSLTQTQNLGTMNETTCHNQLPIDDFPFVAMSRIFDFSNYRSNLNKFYCLNAEKIESTFFNLIDFSNCSDSLTARHTVRNELLHLDYSNEAIENIDVKSHGVELEDRCKNVPNCKFEKETRKIYSFHVGKLPEVPTQMSIGMFNNPKNPETYCCYLNKAIHDSINFEDKDVPYECLKVNSYEVMDNNNLVKPYVKQRAVSKYASNSLKENCFDSGKCTGDEVFCQQFGCLGSSEIFCTIDREVTQLRAIIEGSKYPINEISQNNKIVHVRKANGLISTDICVNCIFDCVDGIIHINTRSMPVTNVKVCSENFCMFTDVDGKDFYISTPNDFRISNETIKVILKFKETNTMALKELRCGVMDECKFHYNMLQMESWINVRCIKVWQWIILFILLLTTLIILYMIVYILKYLYVNVIKRFVWPTLVYIVKIIWYFFKWVAYKLTKTTSILPVSMKNEHVFEDIQEKQFLISSKPKLSYAERAKQANVSTSYSIVNENYISPESPYSPNLTSPIRAKKYLQLSYMQIILLIGILCIGLGGACDVTTTLSVTQEQCITTDSGKDICSLTSSMRIAVAPVGQSSCLLLKQNGKIVGNMIVKTKSINLTCLKNSLYYIPNVATECHNAYNCHGAGFCSMDYRECNNPSSYTRDIFSDQSGYLYWHECVQKPTSSECYYSSSSCLHVLKKLMIKNKSYAEVYDCSSWVFSATVEVIRVNNVVESSKELILLAGQPLTQDAAKLSLISVSTPPSTGFNKCFIKRDGLWTFSECNKRGEYVVGKIGEIQCPDVQSATTSNQMGKCFAKSELIKVQEQNQYISCHANFVNLDSYFRDNVLPVKYGEYLLKTQSDELMMVINGGSLLEIQIDFKNYEILSKSDLNKCFVTFKSLTGCYSCVKGATLEVETNTNFGSATGTIKCPSINFQTIIQSSSEPKIQNITLHSNIKSINAKCSIECPEGETDFHIKGELFYVPNDDKRDNSTTAGISDNVSGAIDWANMFKNPFSFSFGIVLILIIIIIVLYLIKSFSHRPFYLDKTL
ncbi:glycoprotein [Pidgey virus]|uniref:Envelopment polyprotein n=1 Tax=Pidgey virus TaxID=1911436 RepID=A0A2Z2CKJ5_9VIRU|nr:glycoprotein [Pidgey virus]AOX47533.1 glycoprotein [Pidgey virus]